MQGYYYLINTNVYNVLWLLQLGYYYFSVTVFLNLRGRVKEESWPVVFEFLVKISGAEMCQNVSPEGISQGAWWKMHVYTCYYL